MWYPFKFWRKLGYVYVTGRLAELCGRPDERPKRRTLRAVERAKKADGGYQLGVPHDDWQLVAIEGWAIKPDSSLRSVTARFANGDGADLWIETSIGHRSALGLLDPGAWPNEQSPFEGIVTTEQGRIIELAYLAGEQSQPPQLARMSTLAELLRC